MNNYLEKKLFIKNIFFTILAIFATLLLSCSTRNLETANVAETKKEKAALTHNLTLIVTSDIHAGVNDNFTLAGVYEKRKEYEEKGDYTLLIDNGDVLQGGFLSSLTKGSDLMEIIKAAHYDILTFGNHEFDYGMDQFFENASILDVPYISSNFTKDDKLIFDPYVIKEFDGVRFAFIGINTPDTLTTSKPIYFEDENGDFIYGFYQGDNGEKLYRRVQETIDEVKSKGVNYIIAVAHIGEKETSKPYRYNDIISHTCGFDVFLDGHSHDTDQVTMKDKGGHDVIRLGVGTKLSNIGIVTFTTEGDIQHELLTYEKRAGDKDIPTYDNEVSKIVKEKNEKVELLSNEVIGHSNFDLVISDPEAKDSAGVPIRIVRRMETNLGDLVADAYKVRTGADVGYINGGGVRTFIEKGDITIGDIKDVQPFSNLVCVINVTGSMLLDALEWGCHVTPAESGGFPHVSGMSFELDTSIPDPCIVDDDGICTGIEGERRIKNLMINGAPVDPNQKYKLAILSYTALDNGDGYTAFNGAEVLEMGSAEDYSLVVDYIKENLGGEIPDEYKDPYGDGRIIIK